MNPAIKYTLGRFAVFIVVFALISPIPLNILVRAMIALLASAAFSYFLLAKWRNEMAEQLGSAASRRAQERNRLRAALAGDETAAAQGDRAAGPGPAQTGTSTRNPTPTDDSAAARDAAPGAADGPARSAGSVDPAGSAEPTLGTGPAADAVPAVRRGRAAKADRAADPSDK